jgi:glycine oxidase
VRDWDVIIVGGGIIGLSLAIELRKRGVKVLIVERGQVAREASHAAGGMLVDSALETPAALQSLATASARLYPEFVYELQVESGVNADLRDQGTILFVSKQHLDARSASGLAELTSASMTELESSLAGSILPAFYLKERSVDPRGLSSAALGAAKRRGVDISSGDEVIDVVLSEGRVRGIVTTKTSFRAEKVVNCAGAWAGLIAPHAFPTRPVKGQMLCLAAPSPTLLKHVIRTPDVYLIPRSDGRILVGATVEEAGFDKRTNVEIIQRLHRAAVATVPELRNARTLENWAGLRPGTPDALPILGATSTPGYFVATGHFRDGILLAPITAVVMANLITGVANQFDLRPFSPARFG